MFGRFLNETTVSSWRLLAFCRQGFITTVASPGPNDSDAMAHFLAIASYPVLLAQIEITFN
jgi:hypothetical protein